MLYMCQQECSLPANTGLTPSVGNQLNSSQIGAWSDGFSMPRSS